MKLSEKSCRTLKGVLFYRDGVLDDKFLNIFFILILERLGADKKLYKLKPGHESIKREYLSHYST
jgi:hypothetical protein